ncbi:MAG: aminotransferase class III-fold pyridoxal phosphate-dependent enzyme, partial [Hyphomicrobiales bacterium]|nr:aminotransferase class III-fold pyridoxal phosphate-dependent enzyme [Hyphomicrobiales bacterium]
VMAGFGRTGKWFACDHWDVVPDILTVAKGLNSGYVPLGAMIVSEPIADWLKTRKFPGGMTYAGHPLACASGVASIRAMIEENIVERAATSGRYLRQSLDRLAERHPSIGEIRGEGLFYGLELVKDRESRTPLVPFNATGADNAPMQEMLKFAMAEGLYLSSFSNVIRLTPPLNISEEDLDFACGILDQMLEIADRHCAN